MMRANGQWVCAQEGCGKPLSEITIKQLDPFCSTACCHEFHGVEIQLPGRGQFVASSRDRPDDSRMAAAEAGRRQ